MAGNRQLQILDDLLKTAERNFDAAVKQASTVDDRAQKTTGPALCGDRAVRGFHRLMFTCYLADQSPVGRRFTARPGDVRSGSDATTGR